MQIAASVRSGLCAGADVSGPLTVRGAGSVGRDTIGGRIISRVEEPQTDGRRSRPPPPAFTRRFVPVPVALATLTCAVTDDARQAMTMLLVGCSCAADLATPTAISAGRHRQRRRPRHPHRVCVNASA